MDDHSRPVTGYPAQPNTVPNGHNTATGTAYPYAAPPPHQTYYPPQPNPYYTDPYYSAQRATFIRRIFAILIASIIITGTVIFIIWLVLRPRVPEFRVDSVTVTNFNLSTTLITGNWDVQFTVRNPNNKITLTYDQILARVLYKSGALSETMVPPFVQGKRNETAVRATFAAASSYVENWVVNGINGDRGRGSVKFTVRMLARVRFRAGSWWARRRVVRVLCPDLSVGLSSNSERGSLVGGSRECRVGL